MSTTSRSSAKTTCFCLMHPGQAIEAGDLAVRATTSDGQTLYTHFGCSGTAISLGRERSLGPLTNVSLVGIHEGEIPIELLVLAVPDDVDQTSQQKISNCADLASNVVKLELGIVEEDGGTWTELGDLGKNEFIIDPTWNGAEFIRNWDRACAAYARMSSTVRTDAEAPLR